MNDLYNRFRTLDDLPVPDLWHEAEARAQTLQQRGARPLSWALVAMMLLLALAIGSAALIGSGVIKLPAIIDSSADPSSSPLLSATPGWSETGRMIQARTGHTATLLPDGSVLVAGGYRGIHNFNPAAGDYAFGSAELYDPESRTWTSAGNMTVPRWRHTATLLPDGRVLVVGGFSGNPEDSALASAELYDPSSRTWTRIASMGAERGLHTATLLTTGEVLVSGGRGVGDEWASTELFDPRSGTWAATGNMASPRLGHSATILSDGRVLVVGGEFNAPEAVSAELYDPGSRTWTSTESGLILGSTSVTLLSDGRVLVGPGRFNELYDPSTDTWIAAEPMIASRVGGTATLLPTGEVLVAGGEGIQASRAITATAELFDPRTGGWSSAGRMIAGRSGHTATLLSDGRVLVVGGGGFRTRVADDSAIGEYILSDVSAELYDPGRGT